MNHVGAGTLDSVQSAVIATDLTALLGDSDTAVSASVFTPNGSPGMDPITGQVSAPGTTDTVSGWLGPLTLREITASSGTYQQGDQRLIVMASGLSTAPDTDSTYRIATTTYAVVTAEKDALGLTWQLVGRPR